MMVVMGTESTDVADDRVVVVEIEDEVDCTIEDGIKVDEII